MVSTQILQMIINTVLKTVKCYILELISLMFVVLFTLWAFAFLANGLYDYHFDLQSCWGGFSAIGGAGVMATVKYCVDSWKNSDQGKMPEDFIAKFDVDGDHKLSVQEMIEALKHLKEKM